MHTSHRRAQARVDAMLVVQVYGIYAQLAQTLLATRADCLGAAVQHQVIVEGREPMHAAGKKQKKTLLQRTE